jgi:hypothetical protein
MSVTDPAQSPPTRPAPTGGVDWGSADHAICVVGDEGQALTRITVAHDAAGLRTMVTRLLRAGVERVGIERPDGPVVDALRQGGLTVYVIPPGQLKNLRSRYGSAGNKDDRFDAYVLADVVRTDHRRLRPIEVDTEATTTLRQSVRARRDLVAHRVAVANQLRAHLQIVFPAAVGLFADIDSAISLRFLDRFPTADKAAWLSPKRMSAWLASVGYCGRTDHAVLHARLAGAPAGATGPAGEAGAAVTAAYTAVLRAISPHRGTTDAAPRRADLHQPPPLRHRARSPAARRDRRRPRPVPHRGLPGLPRRGRALHPPVRQDQVRRIPLRRGQAAARRAVRLRRRLPPRQPLGRRALRPSTCPRARPRPRRTHPRPRLGTRDLALLAGPHPLRPRPPRRPPARPQPRPTGGGLTQGNSWVSLVRV